MNLTEILMISCVLLPMAAAPAAYAMRKCKASWSDGFVSAICLLVLIFAAVTAGAGAQSASISKVFLLGVSFSAGGFKTVFAVLCAFMFFMSSLANPAYFRGEPHTERYRAFLLLTLGGIMGVFLAGDLFTLYICFETMSLASWAWVIHNETPGALKAADTYLAMAMIGGLVMLYGLFVLYHRFGTLSITRLKIMAAGGDQAELLVPGICLLVGFGIKAGMFPFHVWLPKSHPVAPAPSSALLSGILTKSGIYGILLIIVCLLWKNAAFSMLILILGTITMLLGAVIAIFSVDLKRTLACSSLSQVGFILVGAGILSFGEAPDLAAGGLMAHAVNHALTKLVLFLAAGVLYKQCHTLDLNRLKGAGRNCLPLKICFLVGGVSLAGVPGFGGYISKTLLHESIVHQMHLCTGSLETVLSVVEVLFLISGGLTLAYMTKLFVKIFIEKPDDKNARVRADKGSLTAIIPAAAALLVMGLLPAQTYEAIAAFAASSLRSKAIAVSYFTLENLKGAGISLLIGAAVYLLVVRGLLTDRRSGCYTKATLLIDLEDDVYRPLVNALAFVGAFAARVCYCITDGVVFCVSKLLNHKAAQRINPGKDYHFSRYNKSYTKVGPIIQTLQFELMLFGVGVVAILVFLWFHM